MRVRFLAVVVASLVACGDDPVVPPAEVVGGAAGASGDAGAAGAASAGAAGTSPGGGGLGGAGPGGAGGAGAGPGGAGPGGAGPGGAGAGGANVGGAGAAGTSGAGPAGAAGGGGTPTVTGKVHGTLRDVGGGKMALRLGDFPFACAELVTAPTCGPSARALVAANLDANKIAPGELTVLGSATGTAAAPGCGASSSPFESKLTVIETTDALVKIKVSNATLAGIDGDYSLTRCTASVPLGNAVATHVPEGLAIEAGDYSITCANAPTTPACGEKHRVRLTLPPALQKVGTYSLSDTIGPGFTSTSMPAPCTPQEGALNGQIEVLEVRADRVRVRLSGTNLATVNKVLFEALFCD